MDEIHLDDGDCDVVNDVGDGGGGCNWWHQLLSKVSYLGSLNN